MVGMKPLQHLLTTLLAACTLASCAQTPAEPESQRLARELRTLIGSAACTADSQCRSLPVGAKACGGPAGYWAWSTQHGDAQRIAELASSQAEAQRREIEASGQRSNCALLPDPGAACVAGRCQIQPPGGAR